jgi:cob(I)alamin adenosyltransferase
LQLGPDWLEGGDTLIQVYTGNGKGKTTAAMGLALRAAGAGLKVYICQFLKGKKYCELIALKKFKNIKIEQFGKTCFVRGLPKKSDLKLARQGFEKIKNITKIRSYDMVILDEINIALHLKLLPLSEFTTWLKSVPQNLELILTGRYAPDEVLKLADLVSEIKDRKHYYRKGVKARNGIEF